MMILILLEKISQYQKANAAARKVYYSDAVRKEDLRGDIALIRDGFAPEYVPELYIHSAEVGEDPDKRDYNVSNEKIESLGWNPDYSLDDGISELVKGYRIIRPNSFSNV